MELPKRLSPPEGCAWNEDSPHFKINEIIDYLESQQCSPFECPGTRQEEPKYTCKDFYKVHEGPCVNCVPKEEPKQVDVLRMIVPEDVELSIPEGCKIYGSILNKTGKPIQVIIKQALQQ